MEDVFNEFEEIIQRGLKNNMPRDAKLITVGQILYAVTRDELTNKEGWQLEAMLGGRKNWEEALEYSIFGYPVDTEMPSLDKPLVIAGKTFHSRLMTGTGKYRSIAEMQQSVNASRCEIVTVAVRRVQTNAPGCQTADEAIRVARLGREMAKLLGQEDNNFVKLEVIPDAKYLLPDPIGTLQAAEQLVKEGFAVLPYINADPMLAKRLEEAGCATVMPLASPIGSGQGINNAANIQIIIDTVNVPVVVDAGIGTPSEAARAMEMGADALLINSAIAPQTGTVTSK